MTTIIAARDQVPLTNLDKMFYPEARFTKGDLVDYYDRISPVMVPHLASHPVTVIRYPDGVDGLSFFEKRAPAKRPPWLKTMRASSERFGAIEFPVIDSRQALVWMANRAAIEFHTYLFRQRAEQRPLMLVFDLDPGAPATLRECLDIGIVIRDLLHDLGLQTFAKTSGGKGLHLVVPVQGASFDDTKHFARQVAELLARQEPRRVTSAMAKAQRSGRVFIDWSQNDHGKTTACAYTLRARTRPTVSTPLAWEEIERARRRFTLERLVFDAHHVLRRVDEMGDLFAPVLTTRQRLPKFP